MPDSETRLSRQRERMARNFAAKHGQDGLAWLIEAIQDRKPRAEIAKRFGLSIERIKQLTIAFGEIVTDYRVHPEVAEIVDEREFGVLEGNGDKKKG